MAVNVSKAPLSRYIISVNMHLYEYSYILRGLLIVPVFVALATNTPAYQRVGSLTEVKLTCQKFRFIVNVLVGFWFIENLANKKQGA